jgi:serine/threonine protein kinase
VVARARRGPGPPVVLKATAPGASWSRRAELRREGRRLDRLRGPGVVELLDVVDVRRRTVLVLAHLPTDLRAHPEVDLEPLQATLARLHRAGVVHDAVTPDHILLTADGDPALCGFGHVHRALPRDIADTVDEQYLRSPPWPQSLG